MKIERGIKLSIILFFITLLVIIGTKKVNSVGCPQDSIAIGNSCCILGATSCDVTNPGSGWFSYNCDTSSAACGKCCSSSGTSSLICKIPNNFYRAFLWFSSRCCGDDPGNAIDNFNGDSTIGCCCASDGRIGWTNDQVCGSNRQWCIDGAYCTNGVVYSSTAFSGIQLSGDNIVCGPCGYSGTICDTNADTLTNGICVSASCLASGTVSKSGSSHYTGCAIGRECDTAISPQYVRDGFCTSIRLNGCCPLTISSGESSGTPTWNSGNEGCDCDSSGSYCDLSPASGPFNDGICASDVCVASGLVSKSGSTYYNVCATGRECTSNVALGPYARNGYCASSSCCTSVISSGESSGAPNWGSGNEACSCGSAGDYCDTTAITGPSSDGICASSGCNSGMISKSGILYYTGCTNNRECDNNVAPGEGYGRTGYCAVSSCCNSIMDSGEYSAPADFTNANGDCSCTDTANGNICSSTVSSASPPSATGICTTTACSTGVISKSGTTHITGCSAGYECDNNVAPGEGYGRTGYCAVSSCCNSIMDSGEYSAPASFIDNNGICGCSTSNGNICSSTVSSGSPPSATGICASSGCNTGIIGKSGTTHITGCSAGYECDNNVAPGEGYGRTGYCASSSCCTSLIASGESSGAPNWNNDNEACSCGSAGDYCDTSPSTGPSSNGICASSTCTSGLVAWSVASGYVTSCANGRECDSSVGAGPYSRNGWCVGTTCATTAVVASTDNSECGILTGCGNGCLQANFNDNDEDFQCDSGNEGAICDATPANGPTAEGVCIDNSCRTSGVVRVNCGTDGCQNIDFTGANMIIGCDSSSGDSCDNNVDSNGYGQTGTCAANTCDTSGETCFDGTSYQLSCSSCSNDKSCDSDATYGGDFNANGLCCSSSCIVNNSRIQGQACCNNANCASGLTCSSGVCAPLDGELYRTQIPDGTYGWKCEAEDTSENIGSSETRIFTLDTKPPIISNVKNTCGFSSITITWETNENANGTVKYGTTLDLTSGINYDINYNLIRSIMVSGLSSGVVHYYNLTSCDRFNHCITSGYYNFTAPG